MTGGPAEARKLWSRFSALRQSGRPMVEHVNDCMTVRVLLEAIGETVLDKQFVDKLLNVDQELSYLRPMLVRAPIAEIVAGLTDGYSYHYRHRQHQNHSGNAGRGRFQRRHRHPRGQGAPAAAAGPPAVAGVNAVSGGEERATTATRLGIFVRTARTASGGPPIFQEASSNSARPWARQSQQQGARRARGRCHQHC